MIDNGCSSHMTGDRRKFINLEEKNGGSVEFGGLESTQICDKGTISIDGKIKIENVCILRV